MPEPLIPSEAELDEIEQCVRVMSQLQCRAELPRLIASLRLLLAEHRAGRDIYAVGNRDEVWERAHSTVERALQPTEVSRG